MFLPEAHQVAPPLVKSWLRAWFVYIRSAAFIIVVTQKLVLRQSKYVTAKCTETLLPPPCIQFSLIQQVNSWSMIYTLSILQWINWFFKKLTLNVVLRSFHFEVKKYTICALLIPFCRDNDIGTFMWSIGNLKWLISISNASTFEFKD